MIGCLAHVVTCAIAVIKKSYKTMNVGAVDCAESTYHKRTLNNGTN